MNIKNILCILLSVYIKPIIRAFFRIGFDFHQNICPHWFIYFYISILYYTDSCVWYIILWCRQIPDYRYVNVLWIYIAVMTILYQYYHGISTVIAWYICRYRLYCIPERYRIWRYRIIIAKKFNTFCLTIGIKEHNNIILF